MEKKIEIVEVDSKKSRLTVTPLRVTIKLSKYSTKEEQEHLKNLSILVAKNLGEVKHSWRGKFNERGIHMTTEYGGKEFFNKDGIIDNQ
jgi:hypothetical protein